MLDYAAYSLISDSLLLILAMPNTWLALLPDEACLWMELDWIWRNFGCPANVVNQIDQGLLFGLVFKIRIRAKHNS